MNVYERLGWAVEVFLKYIIKPFGWVLIWPFYLVNKIIDGVDWDTSDLENNGRVLVSVSLTLLNVVWIIGLLLLIFYLV